METKLQLLKCFPYRFAMFHGRYGVAKTLNKTLQKRAYERFLSSLLHVLKMNFKGSGRFQNVTLLG